MNKIITFPYKKIIIATSILFCLLFFYTPAEALNIDKSIKIDGATLHEYTSSCANADSLIPASFDWTKPASDTSNNTWSKKHLFLGEHDYFLSKRGIIVPDDINKKVDAVYIYFHGLGWWDHTPQSLCSEYKLCKSAKVLKDNGTNAVILVPQNVNSGSKVQQLKKSEVDCFMNEANKIIKDKLNLDISQSSLIVSGHSAGGQFVNQVTKLGYEVKASLFFDACYGDDKIPGDAWCVNTIKRANSGYVFMYGNGQELNNAMTATKYAAPEKARVIKLNIPGHKAVLTYCFPDHVTNDLCGGNGTLMQAGKESIGGVVSEIDMITLKPQPKINIPGLNFTQENLYYQADKYGNEFISVPYLGEYLAAIYKYGVAIMSIIAVVMIINAGFEIIISGGNSEKISEAKKGLLNAIMGLLLAVGSYTIMYVINPELVKFKNLRVATYTAVSLGYTLESEYIEPGDELNKKESSRLCTTPESCKPICDNKAKWSEYRLAHIPDVKESVILVDEIKKQNIKGVKVLETKTRVLPSLINPLKKAGQLAASQGLEITVMSGFRTLERQIYLACDKLSRGVMDSKLIAWPGGSKHGTGSSIDIQLTGATIIDGKLETGPSSPDNSNIQNNDEYLKFNRLLAEIMYKVGWKRLKTEVWHFEYPNSPLEDSRTTSCFEKSCK